MPDTDSPDSTAILKRRIERLENALKLARSWLVHEMGDESDSPLFKTIDGALNNAPSEKWGVSECPQNAEQAHLL